MLPEVLFSYQLVSFIWIMWLVASLKGPASSSPCDVVFHTANLPYILIDVLQIMLPED